jgi:hypothetical protein
MITPTYVDNVGMGALTQHLDFAAEVLHGVLVAEAADLFPRHRFHTRGRQRGLPYSTSHLPYELRILLRL